KLDDHERIVLRHSQLRGEDFSGRTLVQFAAESARLELCRFDGIRIENASFGAGGAPSEYIDCTFDGARLRFGPGGYARFVRCSFRDVDIRDWFCFTVELVDCTFGGRMRRVVFNGTVPAD